MLKQPENWEHFIIYKSKSTGRESPAQAYKRRPSLSAECQLQFQILQLGMVSLIASEVVPTDCRIEELNGIEQQQPRSEQLHPSVANQSSQMKSIDYITVSHRCFKSASSVRDLVLPVISFFWRIIFHLRTTLGDQHFPIKDC